MAEEYQRETTALDTIVPLSPTAGALTDILSKAAGSRTFDKATDSLESIKDAIDTISTPVSTTSATTNGVIVEDGTSGTPNIVALASSATANTFGAWVEVDASVSADSWIKAITVTHSHNNTVSFVIEIGIGGAGSEATKIRFSGYLRYASIAGFVVPTVYNLSIPIKVASGTRIAARVSDSYAAENSFKVGVQYYQSIET